MQKRSISFVQRWVVFLGMLSIWIASPAVFAEVSPLEQSEVLQKGHLVKITKVLSAVQYEAVNLDNQSIWKIQSVGILLPKSKKDQEAAKREAQRLLLGKQVYIVPAAGSVSAKKTNSVWIYYAQGWFLINEDLVERGSVIVDPSYKGEMKNRLSEAEQFAQAQFLGIWKSRVSVQQKMQDPKKSVSTKSSVETFRTVDPKKVTPPNAIGESVTPVIHLPKPALSKKEPSIADDDAKKKLDAIKNSLLEALNSAESDLEKVDANYNIGIYFYYYHQNLDDIQTGITYMAKAIEGSDRKDLAAKAYLGALLMAKSVYLERDQQLAKAQAFHEQGETLINSLVEANPNEWYVRFVRIINSLYVGTYLGSDEEDAKKENQVPAHVISDCETLLNLGDFSEPYRAVVLEKYARALEMSGDKEKAQEQFATLSQIFPEYMKTRMNASAHQEILMDLERELRR